MPRVFWDASALTKRYTLESGGETVDAIFRSARRPMLTTAWGFAETFSVLLRQRNDGRLDAPTFAASARYLQHEILQNDLVEFVTVDTEAVLASISLMARHNLNATDAAILTAFLFHLKIRPGDGRAILVASDQRLLRAAQSEDLDTLDPEAVAPEDVRKLLASR